MRSLRSIGTSQVFRRPRRAALTASGIALGILVFFASQVSIFSMTKAHDDLVEQYTGGTDVAAVPQGLAGAVLPADAVDRLAALPDVTFVTASLRVPATRADDGGAQRLQGLDEEASEIFRFPLVAGRMPAAGADEVVLTDPDHPARVGETLTLLTPTGEHSLTITGVLADEGIGKLDDGTNAFTSLATAERMVGKGAVIDGAKMRLAPGTDVTTWLDEHEYDLVGAQLRDAEQMFGTALGGIGIVMPVFAFMSLFVGGFLISITLSAAVAQRTVELGTLRAIGATRKQIRKIVRAEALGLAAASTFLGLVVGGLLALPMTAFLGNIVDLDASVQIPPNAVVISLLLGIGVSMLAALGPARRAARLSPVVAMRGDVAAQARLSRGWIVGLVLTPLGLFMMLSAAEFNGIGFGMLVLLTGAVLLVPSVLRPLARVVGTVTGRISSGVASITVLHLVKERSRSGYTLALVMVALGLAFGVRMTSVSLRTTNFANIDDSFGADIQVYSPTALTPATIDRVADTPGVAAVSADRFGSTQLLDEDGDVEGWLNLQVIDPATYFDVQGFGWDEGSDEVAKAALAGSGKVLFPAQAARNLDVAVGETVLLRTAAGAEPFEIAATFNGVGPNTWTVVAGPTDGTTHFGAGQPLHLVARVDDGVDRREVRDRLREELSAGGSLFGGSNRFNVLDADDLVSQVRANSNSTSNVLIFLNAVTAFVALLGLANTLALSVLYRHREIGVLRAVGTRRRQIGMSVVVEGATMVAIATILAIPIGMAISYALIELVRSVLGVAVSYTIPVSTVVTLGVIALLFTLAASFVPARKASRLEVVDALRMA